MTQTQIERMAEAIKRVDEKYDSQKGATIDYDEGLKLIAQAALSSMPEPIANYKPEMGGGAAQ